MSVKEADSNQNRDFALPGRARKLVRASGERGTQALLTFHEGAQFGFIITGADLIKQLILVNEIPLAIATASLTVSIIVATARRQHETATRLDRKRL